MRFRGAEALPPGCEPRAGTGTGTRFPPFSEHAGDRSRYRQLNPRSLGAGFHTPLRSAAMAGHAAPAAPAAVPSLHRGRTFWGEEKRKRRACEEENSVKNRSRTVCPPLQRGSFVRRGEGAGGGGPAARLWGRLWGRAGSAGAAEPGGRDGAGGGGGVRAAALLLAGPGGRGWGGEGGVKAGLGRGGWYLPQKCSNSLPSPSSLREVGALRWRRGALCQGLALPVW